MNRLALVAMAGACAAMPTLALADVEFSSTGSGDALYLPYWSVADDHETRLAVANTQDTAKAVRVHVVGGADGAPLLAFNLYLGPNDHWDATLTAAADGTLALASDDASCTLPTLASIGGDDAGDDASDGNGNGNGNGDDDDDEGDNGNDDAAPDAQLGGALEIVEMGVLPIESPVDVADCATLVQAFEAGGDWAEDANAGLQAPTGGLTATVEVVDTNDDTVAAFPATALTGFSARAGHLAPDAPGARLTDPLAVTEGEPLSVRLSDGTTASFGNGVDAISALLMSEALHGEVRMEDAIGAQTRWLVAFPTLHALVDDVDGDAPAANACLAATAIGFDADGLEQGSDGAELCAHTQLLGFGGSADADVQLELGIDDGTARLVFDAGAVAALGYRLTRVGPALPDQASGRADEAVGASYQGVQPLVRSVTQAQGESPAPEVPPAD